MFAAHAACGQSRRHWDDSKYSHHGLLAYLHPHGGPSACICKSICQYSTDFTINHSTAVKTVISKTVGCIYNSTGNNIPQIIVISNTDMMWILFFLYKCVIFCISFLLCRWWSYRKYSRPSSIVNTAERSCNGSLPWGTVSWKQSLPG